MSAGSRRRGKRGWPQQQPRPRPRRSWRMRCRGEPRELVFMQCSDQLITPNDEMRRYYSAAYSRMPGYVLPEHYFEIPFWIALCAGLLPASEYTHELHVVEDLDRSVAFMRSRPHATFCSRSWRRMSRSCADWPSAAMLLSWSVATPIPASSPTCPTSATSPGSTSSRSPIHHHRFPLRCRRCRHCRHCRRTSHHHHHRRHPSR